MNIKMIKRNVLPVIVFMVVSTIPALSMSESGKIDLLLSRIEKSNLIFIRNGAEYTSKRAREHLEYKYSRAGDRIQTARQFIKFIATRSYLTGIPYYVRYPDGRKIKTSNWLLKQLKQIEKSE